LYNIKSFFKLKPQKKKKKKKKKNTAESHIESW
jgi:hypothetical protein